MLDKVCFNCFTKKQNDGPCPVCGFDNRTGKGRDLSYGVSLMPGTILSGRYIVGKTLGQGGFGITYLALDLQTGEKFAIKEFFPSHLVVRQESGLKTNVQPNSSKDEDIFRYGLKKFKEEAELLASFRNQKHIVSIHRFFYENNTGYFVMEFIDGVSLKDYVKRMNGRLLYPDVVGIFEPVLMAISFIHSKGLIHRDISPDNIYIRKDGTVKLLDFGAARFYVQSKGKAMTTILKPGFAPPEQYSSTGKQGPWSDIYAVAGSMYYALIGKTPLDALSRKLDDQLVRPTAVNPSISPAQEAVLLKGLAVDSSKRYANAAEFAEALKRSLRMGVSRRMAPDLASAPALVENLAVRQGQPQPLGEPSLPRDQLQAQPINNPDEIDSNFIRSARPSSRKNNLPAVSREPIPEQSGAAESRSVFDPFPFENDDEFLVQNKDDFNTGEADPAGKENRSKSVEDVGAFSMIDYILVGSLGAIILLVLLILFNF